MPIRVLVVDDETAVCDNVAAFLEDENMLVATAESGEQALMLVAESDDFDVCVMDMRLPGMDGNTAILAMHEMRPALSFIIHTGSANYALPPTLRAIGIGERDIFMKPLSDMQLLAQAIIDRVARRESASDGL